ncbi:uncharacterized protein LOC133476089 [Phyllopteryx taeniolatus]|uniref:uncharacterized protein LOC133476089 n=1 Tax=Phyllopteryx taeniolatus TaxID=161469 RepID=UPI002AD35E14|nr:uncharacterized protein LOC133476089 [Phyllopteryx taeniolatus]
MEIGGGMHHRALGGRASVTSQTKADSLLPVSIHWLASPRMSPCNGAGSVSPLREGRCFYCGQLGHSVSNCHVKVAGAGSQGTGEVSLNFIKEDPTRVLPKVTLCSPDLSQVPTCYQDIKDVFSKAKSLPPHRPYDCAIDLLPGTTPPRGRLFSLSGPEHKAMKEYVEESLAAGIIRPSSSPAGAGFFFVDKKDKTLRPCIDYRGLNEITVKNSSYCRINSMSRLRNVSSTRRPFLFWVSSWLKVKSRWTLAKSMPLLIGLLPRHAKMYKGSWGSQTSTGNSSGISVL